MKRIIQSTIFIILIISAVCIAATYEYDSLHRLTKVTYENGDEIVYTYDEVGNRTRRVFTPVAPVKMDIKEDFETGDFRELDWSHSGDADWSTTSDERHSGHYSARAGQIADDERTSLHQTIQCVTGNVSFYVKVSSEQTYDRLEFFINGTKKGEWSGQQDWQLATFPITNGLHTFTWTYTKDESLAEGDDTAWIDDIVFPIPVEPETPPLASVKEGFETAGFDGFEWRIAGDAGWRISPQAYIGMYSVQAGQISNDERTSLELTRHFVRGNITFFRKVSCEEGYDFLRFYIDEVIQSEWSRQEDWQQATFVVTEGMHTFTEVL